ncbi:MAG: acyl-CoA dehydrogenase family protein [Anaerolineales bacterium]
MRIANAATAVGVANAAFEYSMNYAKERVAFGVKIAQKQAIAFMLAEMRTEIEAMRGRHGQPRGSWTRGAEDAANAGVSRIHWRGGYGDDGHRPRRANSRRHGYIRDIPLRDVDGEWARVCDVDGAYVIV